jgi:hypothetical protein
MHDKKAIFYDNSKNEKKKKEPQKVKPKEKPGTFSSDN